MMRGIEWEREEMNAGPLYDDGAIRNLLMMFISVLLMVQLNYYILIKGDTLGSSSRHNKTHTTKQKFMNPNPLIVEQYL